jgi:hypothetical protein
MKFNPKGLIVTGAFILVFLVAMRANAARTLDFWTLIIEATVLGALSVLVIVSRFGRRATPRPLSLLVQFVAAILVASFLVWISGGVRPAY